MLVEDAVRAAVGKKQGAITPSDAQGLKELNLAATKCDDIRFLSDFTNLTVLDLANEPSLKTSIDNQVSDLTPLQGMTELQQLYLTGNHVRDLTPLGALSSLHVLHFGGNEVSDLTPLAALTNITSLDLWSNQITDLSPLQGLPRLKELYIFDNPIVDLTPLYNTATLQELAWGNNLLRNQQVESLQKELPSLEVWETAFQYSPAPAYQEGSAGEAVLKIKQRLQDLGYFTIGSALSDKYNATCTERVKPFQSVNGIPETGLMDKQTRLFLFSDKALANPNPR